jgi:hypothetical protein
MLSPHQHAATRELHNMIIDPDLKRVEIMQKHLHCSAQDFTYNGAECITAGTRTRGILPTVLLLVIYCDTAVNVEICYCIQFHTGAKFHTVVVMVSLWENTGWFKKMDSISCVCISWTIHGVWMIYITFERWGPKVSNTTARALA